MLWVFFYVEPSISVLLHLYFDQIKVSQYFPTPDSPSVPVAAVRQMVEWYWRDWRGHQHLSSDSSQPRLALSLIKTHEWLAGTVHAAYSVKVEAKRPSEGGRLAQTRSQVFSFPLADSEISDFSGHGGISCSSCCAPITALCCKRWSAHRQAEPQPLCAAGLWG